jgi:hypothetical protein
MSSQPENDSRAENVTSVSGAPEILVLNRDLFFGVTIGNTLRALGYRVTILPTTEKLIAALERRDMSQALAIVDMNAGVDWNSIAAMTAEGGPGVPVLVFGSHLDVEGRRAAKAAGVARVLSNGDFHKDMGGYVRRYARQSPGSGGSP